MSKHKAPTQVTIAPTEEQSAFAAFVHRAWKPFVSISIAVLGLVYFRGMSQESERETQYGDWDLVSSTLGLSLASAELKASEDEVERSAAADEPNRSYRSGDLVRSRSFDRRIPASTFRRCVVDSLRSA